MSARNRLPFLRFSQPMPLKEWRWWLTLPMKPLEANTGFFLFMFLLGCLCMEATRVAETHPTFYAHGHWELFFDLYLLCTALTLLPRTARRWAKAVTATVLYAVAAADVFCFSNFKSTLTPTMLMLLGETNGREACEFLRTYVNADTMSSQTAAVVLLALLHLTASLKPGGWTSFQPFAEQKQNGFSRLLPILSPALPGLILASLIISWPNKAATCRLMSYDRLGDVEHELTEVNTCARLYLPIYRLIFSIKANRLAAGQTRKLTEASTKVVIDSCAQDHPSAVVLIIGESYNRHHSQLYGYEKPTTPRQIALHNEGGLTVFTDVVAPWNLTSYVFKHMFSLYCVGDEGEWCDYPLFPQLFRKAGWKVTFLTNQFLPKAGEAVYDFSGGFFLNHPELSRQMFDHRSSRVYPYDEGLLEDSTLLADNGSGNTLTIYHLMGQHVMYGSRFPKGRRKFFAKDYDRPDLTGRQRQVMADYDNAVLYNDSIVRAIVGRYEHDDAVVVYVPDHGEECFGDGLAFFGRLHSTKIDARLAREEFEIPFWIWTSPVFRRNHSIQAKTIGQAANRPYMTDALPHLLLSLAGIITPLYRPQLDVLSPHYQNQRPRLLKASTDYNLLDTKRGQKCDSSFKKTQTTP